MKNIFKYMSIGACALAVMTAAGCADTDGNGEGEFTWEGSQNPENTSYRNPVWEPSLAGGTVLKAASGFNAISQETQWAAGLDWACPSLQSTNLMTWSSNQQAFTYPTPTGETDKETGEAIITPGSYPEWLTAKINHVSADFAKTIAGANYWMFYGSEQNGGVIGAASASSSGMGPYTDMGCVLTAEDLGVKTLEYPYFLVATTNFYLCYTTEAGSFVQPMNIRKGALPSTKGAATQLAGPEFKDVCIYRRSSSEFYLFGTVETGAGSEIRYGRASKVTGPYTDKAGNELTSGASNGELLVEGGTEYAAPCNPMRMFESENGYFYLAYNATAIGRENMESGFARQPLFINPVEMDEDGWFTTTIIPATGWTTPRYQ